MGKLPTKQTLQKTAIRTAVSGAYFTINPTHPLEVQIWMGHVAPAKQWLAPPDIREMIEVLEELHGMMESAKVKEPKKEEKLSIEVLLNKPSTYRTCDLHAQLNLSPLESPPGRAPYHGKFRRGGPTRTGDKQL